MNEPCPPASSWKGFWKSTGRSGPAILLARYIRERRWHPTQESEEMPDGGLLLRFRTGGLAEVRRWVMSYGSHAEVLVPENLRREVGEEIRKMVRLYENICEKKFFLSRIH